MENATLNTTGREITKRLLSADGVDDLSEKRYIEERKHDLSFVKAVSRWIRMGSLLLAEKRGRASKHTQEGWEAFQTREPKEQSGGSANTYG